MANPGKEAMVVRALRWLTRQIVQWPGITLTASLLLAGAAGFYALSALRFKTNRADLLNPKSTYNTRWLRYVEEFGEQQDLVVAAEGDDPTEVAQALDEVASAIRARPQQFGSLLHRVEDWPPPEKLLLFAPHGVLQQLADQLQQYEPLLQGRWSLLNLPDIYQSIRHQMSDGAAGSADREVVRWLDMGDRFSQAVLAYLVDPTDYRSQEAMALLAPWSSALEQLGSAAMSRSPPSRLQLLQVRSAARQSRFTGEADAVDQVRDIVTEVTRRHPQVQLGLTGLPVLESDEMRSSQRSMGIASVLSLVGVAGLFVIGFRGVRYPLLATVTLVIGISLSLGYLTLIVGHLNILSMAFSIILIGLGIDYSIHYLARYLGERQLGQHPAQALDAAVTYVGPGLVTAALTTAIAFFMAALTDFLGVAELGIIVGGGILLCLATSLVVLPALVVLRDSRRDRPPIPVPFWVAQGLRPLWRHPGIVIAVFTLATGLLGVFAFRVRYDHNLMNLQPAGLDSVRWQRRILDHSDRSVWSAVSLADSPAEALRLKERFLAQPTVKHVDEIASMLPLDQERNLPLLRSIAERLAVLPDEAPMPVLVDPAGLHRQVRLLHQAMETWAQRADASDAPSQRHRQTLAKLDSQLATLSVSEQYERLAGFQRAVVTDLIGRLRALRTVAVAQPVTVDDLPPALRERFVSDGGKWLLKVYARDNVWDMEPLTQFVREVREVDPEATGSPLQTYEASRQMKRSYEWAAFYALTAIVVLLAVNLRRISLVMLALLPLAVGVTMLLGVLALLGIDLNPANMIVLPLILGIGVDNGVHVLHDYRLQRGQYHLSPSTACAVLLTSLTTMIGFGSLMIAEHRGVRSLGLVLVLGVGLCLLASLLFLPAVLKGLRDRAGRRPAGSPVIPPPHHRLPARRQARHQHL